jgi:hypothetical protein
MEGTKVIMVTENGTFSAAVNQSDMTLTNIVEDVIIPVLLAAGYAQATIDECLHA